MNHEYYLRIALQEAEKAFEKGEIPVGAVIVARGEIIARAHNQTELLNDVTAHAEMLAITAATNFLGSKYLNDCTLYVTLEPCLMCATALHWAQLHCLVFGAYDEKKGYSRFISQSLSKAFPILHPRTQVLPGILEKECQDLLLKFFQKLRN